MNPPFDKAMIRIGTRCNMACPDCFNRHRPAMKELIWEEFDHAVERLSESKVHFRVLTFTGGEPTLWPHLARAVQRVKDAGLADRVQVVTNAARHDIDISLYGPADIISISHYGAQNAVGRMKLLRQDRRRVRVKMEPHEDSSPRRNDPAKVLPARCSCAGLSIANGKVYPCSVAAQYDVNGCSVDSDFVAYFESFDAFGQDLCVDCFDNLHTPARHPLPLVIEVGIWESGLWWMWVFPWRCEWLRRLYRMCLRVRRI